MLDKQKLILESENAVTWIKKYVEENKSKGVVIGNSGGKDSATVIAMATKALGKEKVLTVAMPCNSNKEDLEDAKLVSNKFQVPFIEIDLAKIYNEYENTITRVIETNISDNSKTNIKPRLRMTTLYAIAQTMEYLVIGTGNLCEILVGYTTKWGDSAYDFNPIGNFTATEVLEIGKYLGVPDKILKKSPNDGLGMKTDEEKMGVTYKQIEKYIETGRTDDAAMKIIEKLNNSTQHKRKKVPIYTFERKKFLM